MKKIVFATNNRHKLEEIRRITAGTLEILSLADIGCNEEIDETGSTLEENALIKAVYIRNHYGHDCFADDTGLEVEALGGEPGVYSARYAGDACRADDNMEKLLTEMRDLENRNARFRTVIALLCDGERHLFEGVIRGSITRKKRGSDGFGYDPLFLPEGYNQTFAELGNEVKNRISHRALATAKLMHYLLDRFHTV
jgi:XTP/dITP diphosphohydrolase